MSSAFVRGRPERATDAGEWETTMNKLHAPQTREEQKQDVRRLDIQWNDTLILVDGRVVQAVEQFDGIIKVMDQGTERYI